MRSCIYILLILSTLSSLYAVRYLEKGDRGDTGGNGQCRRDQKGAPSGTDVMYRSPNLEGCCDPGFRYRENRCVGCAYGLRYTKCRHQCTLYCDIARNEPFLNCSGLSGSFYDVCEPGCVCPPDQYETVGGECVFLEEICEDVITPTEPGITTSGETCTDPNMFYDECQPSCITTCRNYLIDGACAAVCMAGCRCKDGLILDEYTSNCVLPANCTALTSLPPNTNWGCCEGDCDQPFPGKCQTCEFGPHCMPGFVRDRYRNCVDFSYCVASRCSENEVYDQCPWESSCLVDNSENVAAYCVAGCRCKGSYVRDILSGECILPANCPVTCSGAYEIPGCSSCDKSCATIRTSAECFTCQQLDTCVCDTGYVRNADGDCVRPSSCPACTECVSTDNDENYKQEECLPLLCYADDKVTYTVRFVGTWDRSTHPDFGFFYSHWSPLTGASHKPSYEIWENCFKEVTTGVRNVAERGDPSNIIQEYATHPDDVLDTINDGRLLSGDSEITRRLDVNKHFHYITLLSMMGNTKDYMVGVDRLDMCNNDRTTWKDYVKVCLTLYSTGTKTVLETGCAAHSRQFENCSFGYIELTKNPVETTRCTGDNEEPTNSLGLCDVRCEHVGGTTNCPRIVVPGCNCIRGYARNERDECVPVDQCTNPHPPNQDCGVSQWMDSGIAKYPDNTVKRLQIRYVTQRPTRSFSSACLSENTRVLDYCEGDECQMQLGDGCAIWVDTCDMEVKCGTTAEFDQFAESTDRIDGGFFEPMRTHGSTTTSFSSLDLHSVPCGNLGIPEQPCSWFIL